jgi:site-specific recombinase XerC
LELTIKRLAFVGFQGLMLAWASGRLNPFIKLLKNNAFKDDAGRANRVVRHGYIHDPGIQQEPRSYIRTRADESPYLFLSNRQVPISRYTLHHLMQTYGAVAGLLPEKRKFHGLKHSIATHLLDAGADLAFVRDWLGHANIQNTTIYARLTTATLDNTARKVFASHRVV